MLALTTVFMNSPYFISFFYPFISFIIKRTVLECKLGSMYTNTKGNKCHYDPVLCKETCMAEVTCAFMNRLPEMQGDKLHCLISLLGCILLNQ